MDINFKVDDFTFSYRVAGICIVGDKVLLQKPLDEDGYSFPGGHVELGETNAQTLVREFKEEIGADISVGDLKWVHENLFSLKSRKWHQICLYYIVNIKSNNIQTEGKFMGVEEMDNKKFKMEFFWVPIKDLKNLKVFPTNCYSLMSKLDNGIQYITSLS